LAYIILLIVSTAGAFIVHKLVIELSDNRDRALKKNKFLIGTIIFAALALLYNKLGVGAGLYFYIYLVIILTTMSIIDLDTGIIPDELVIAGLAGGIALFVLNLVLPCRFGYSLSRFDPVFGLLIGSGTLIVVMILGMIIYRTDEVMGMGDVKIFAPIGMFLGFKLTVMALFFSMLTGGIISLGLIVLKIRKRKDTIPFGPFIAIGAFLAILFGNELWNWYFSFL
jgi:leader peptidase (prepilin peptidase)/N-methyltransferase